MDLSVSSLHRLAAAAFEGQGFSAEDARDVSAEFVVAELSGARTHGVGKIVSLNLGDLSATPTYTRTGAVLSVDGNGASGLLLMRDVARRLAATTAEFGVAVASVRNFSRYGSLYPYPEILAERGYAALLMNSAGPAAVAPFGAADPITGTNPICFAFPTADGVHVFDLATAEVVWGELRQATLEGRPARGGAFLDVSGAVTSDPAEVNAVKAFGGAKGFALNLAIEILAGLLSGGRAGLAVESEYDCGALLLAVDPIAAGGGTAFPALASALFDEVRAAKPLQDGVPVRAPGDSGRSRVRLPEAADEIVSVPDRVVGLLERMGRGDRIADMSSNPLFN